MTFEDHRTWLCELATSLSTMTWKQLTKAHRSDGRLALREEFVTSLVANEIYDAGASKAGPPVWAAEVKRSEERSNGADLEIWFLRSRSDRVGVGWRIQAKRLYEPSVHGPCRYEELHHGSGTSLFDQHDLLINSCGAGLEPVYWLYNFDATHPVTDRCRSAHCPRWQCHPPKQPSTMGIGVVDATDVKRHIEAGNPSDWHDVWRLGQPLRDIWCTPSERSAPDEDSDDPAFTQFVRGLAPFRRQLQPVQAPAYVRLLVGSEGSSMLELDPDLAPPVTTLVAIAFDEG